MLMDVTKYIFYMGFNMNFKDEWLQNVVDFFKKIRQEVKFEIKN
jgi:hypothetical protein